MNDNHVAFLDMIAWSELGQELIDISDNGYNVLVGSTAKHPILFDDYSDHPRRLIDLGRGLKSTAAGRYQLLSRYYDAYKKQLDLPDFSPASQDAIALQQIKECRAIYHIENGDIETAIAKCSRIWASLPGNSYGQHTQKLEALLEAYTEAGGVLI